MSEGEMDYAAVARWCLERGIQAITIENSQAMLRTAEAVQAKIEADGGVTAVPEGVARYFCALVEVNAVAIREREMVLRASMAAVRSVN